MKQCLALGHTVIKMFTDKSKVVVLDQEMRGKDWGQRKRYLVHLS